ncbi:Actin family protein [Trichomonas vaginalis G3]|uniref:Actin family protein n=1 Tax=Trichomonas vaginalis (strain ATCC PRA-98 / G3) TaxID=412133 RepID=A2DBN6_TRIV3|nr:actin [Trichomonas vaginalis G3]EAY22239.1 Actin family protein [Trichomonas vaginalis G3]KAI5533289.1 actin [Trichomonas vaginalis G3]|eukprot:XP_001583225.1 Actin family protein [Trichomonas vaginalis G3]
MEVSTIVIDTGAYSTRAGFGGDSDPQCILPTVIGRLKSPQDKAAAIATKDIYVGSEVFEQSKNLNLKCPISDRVISNIDEIEVFWQHIFSKELNINTSEHPVLMTESPQNTKIMREKVTQIMMETFKVPAYYTAYPGVLSLYANGMASGCVIDAGETITQILPVYQCFGMTHITGKVEVGGRSLNAYLKKLLNDHDITLPQQNEREIVRDIKEQLCYVATDFNNEVHNVDHESDSSIFTLPDGKQIVLGTQRFFCPELFFKPKSYGISSSSLTQSIFDVINKVDKDLRPLMYSNILLSGGSSMFPHFGERISNNLRGLLPPETNVLVQSPANRKNSAWIGGSVLVSLATFSQMWITKEEYDEVGPEVVNLKCF